MAKHAPTPRHTIFSAGLYPVGIAVALFPIADVGSRFFPSQFGNLQWRYTALGLSLSSLSMLVVGITALGFTAAMRRNRGALRVVSIVSGLLAAVVLAALAVFSLDTLHLRDVVRPEAMLALKRSALSAAVGGALHALGLGGVAIATWKAARAESGRTEHAETRAADAGRLLAHRDLAAAEK